MAELVDYALTTLDDVKENLGIATSDHSSDNLIIRKINQATDIIESYTGRRFKLTTYENEEYDATGTNQLVLKNYPVVELNNFGFRESSQNTDDWDDTDSELYFIDKNAGVLDLNFGTGSGWNGYRVSYTAGYDPIPAAISEAAAEVAAYLVSGIKDTISSGSSSVGSIKSKTEGGRKVEYYDNSQSTNNSSSGKNYSILNNLGLLDTLNSYAKLPVLADK